MWWHTLTHGKGKWRGNWRMEWVPRNMVYPALLPLMRTPRPPAVDWNDAPADLNGLVRFAERWNLVSARVPSHFKRSLHLKSKFSHPTTRFNNIPPRGLGLQALSVLEGVSDNVFIYLVSDNVFYTYHIPITFLMRVTHTVLRRL
jgi:hypothetical protein